MEDKLHSILVREDGGNQDGLCWALTHNYDLILQNTVLPSEGPWKQMWKLKVPHENQELLTARTPRENPHQHAY